jgi:hypothetical protein
MLKKNRKRKKNIGLTVMRRDRIRRKGRKGEFLEFLSPVMSSLWPKEIKRREKLV